MVNANKTNGMVQVSGPIAKKAASEIALEYRANGVFASIFKASAKTYAVFIPENA